MTTTEALAWERGEPVTFVAEATVPESKTLGATYAHLVGHVVLLSYCGHRKALVWPNAATARNGWKTHGPSLFVALI